MQRLTDNQYAMIRIALEDAVDNSGALKAEYQDLLNKLELGGALEVATCAENVCATMERRPCSFAGCDAMTDYDEMYCDDCLKTLRPAMEELYNRG